nr:hemin uptake protein HemP [Paenochrobactrum gallinarii]
MQQLANEDAMQQSQPDGEVLVAAQAEELNLKTYGSSELFEGAKEVVIKHAGSVYRLKITRQGKLILNK